MLDCSSYYADLNRDIAEDLYYFADGARRFLFDVYYLIIDKTIPARLSTKFKKCYAVTRIQQITQNEFVNGYVNPRTYYKINSIDVQASFFFSKRNTNKDIFEVLVHEFLHTCFPGDGHQKNWKKYADHITATTNLKISRTGNYDKEPILYKYGAYCPKCKIFVGYYKRNNKFTKYIKAGLATHTKCNTALELYNISCNPRNEDEIKKYKLFSKYPCDPISLTLLQTKE